MRAFHIASAGAPARLTEIDRPAPGAGEILVKIAACGLNFADILMEKGTYQDTPEPPFTLGLEVAGTVEAAGPGVAAPAPGTRVAVFGGHGGLADYGVFPGRPRVAVARGDAVRDAAAFQIAYGTSHVALDHKARLQPGETLLVLGAAGGVGLTAVEIGKLMGARVIACARGQNKLAVARTPGADHLIDAETDDIREPARRLAGWTWSMTRSAATSSRPLCAPASPRPASWPSALPAERCRRFPPITCWSRTSRSSALLGRLSQVPARGHRRSLRHG